MEWQEFEKYIKELLKDDKAVTTPGSGNSKGEEDIVGFSTICQCKCTAKDNISIRGKDLDRLKEAAELQGKTPIFASKCSKDILISLPSQSYTKEVIQLVIILSTIDKLQNSINNTDDIDTIKRLRVLVDSTRLMVLSLTDRVRRKYQKLDSTIEIKYNKLLQHNLFD